VGQHEDREGKRKKKLNEKIKKLSEVEEIVCRGLFLQIWQELGIFICRVDLTSGPS
jgi:hypothetical protein